MNYSLPFRILFLLFFFVSSHFLQAQDLVNISMTVISVEHGVDCGNDGIGIGSLAEPDPSYNITVQALQGGTQTASGFIFIDYENIACGTLGRSDLLVNQTGICANQVTVNADMWEDDGCDANNQCNTCGIFSNGGNSDDNCTSGSDNALIPAGTSGTINLRAAGSGGYAVNVEVNWVRAVISSITGNTALCAGQSTTLTATTSLTTTGGDYYWYDAPVGGNLLFTGQNFNTGPLAAGTSSYYVEYGTASCGTERVQVDVVVGLTTAPTVTAASGCPGSILSLSAAAASATGFNWYNDAAMSTLLGTGATFNTPPLAGTTTYYVTALYGTCMSTPIPVIATELPAPAAPSTSNLQACANVDILLSAVGSGGTLSWYTVPTGGVSIGSGSPFNAGPQTPGSYTYYVAESNGTCEGSRSAIVVTVNPTPNVPTSLDQTVCIGNSATLTASEATATNFNWYSAYPLTTPISTGSVYSTAAINTTTTFYVTSLNAFSCESDTNEVHVFVNSVAAPIAAGISICPGDTALLTASAVGSIQINWYQNADKTGFLASGSSYTTSPSSITTTYYVTALYANGCESLVSAVTVSVSVAPTVPAVTDLSLCSSDSAIFNAFGAGGTISWYDAPVSGNLLATGPVYNAGLLAPGITVVYASEGNGLCGSGLSPAIATVYANPVAPIVFPDTICVGEGASLSVNATSGVFNWYSDASLTALVFVGNSFATPNLSVNTVYYVTEVNNNNCESPKTQVEVVVNTLAANPTVSNDTICQGEAALFIASNNGGVTEWYSDATGLNLLATGPSFSSPSLLGTTSYFVAEISTEGCSSQLVAATAVVTALPLRPTADVVNVCNGDDVILSALGSGTGDLVFFDAANTEIGRTTMSLAVPAATLNVGPLAVGNYTYTVVEENNNCSSSAEAITVNVLTLPAAPVASNDGPVCAGDVIVLQASPAVTGGIFSWTGPAGFVSNSQTIVLTDVSASDVGSYVVNVTIGSCTSDSDSTAVLVQAKPVIPTALTNNGPLCEGDSLVIIAPSIANVSYSWTGPNGFVSTANPVIINPVNPLNHQGIYGLSVTDNTTGCSSDKEFTLVSVNQLPDVSMVQNNSPVCQGTVLNLSVPQVFGATYSWTGPNGFTSSGNSISTTTVNATDAGTYDLNISVAGCSVDLSTDVVVAALPTIAMIADTTFNEGDNIVLYASGGTVFNWAPATNLSNAMISTPILSGAAIGSYNYVLNVSSAQGCTATDSVLITVVPQTQLEIVDLFTPNGDGVNDTWEVNFLQNIGIYSIQVFSRGGLEVMQSENYSSDWDGTFKGNALPEGTYYYIIRTDNKEFKGPLTIKR